MSQDETTTPEGPGSEPEPQQPQPEPEEVGPGTEVLPPGEPPTADPYAGAPSDNALDDVNLEPPSS